MPSRLQFFQNNGTWMSNNHTPLIAHTADDILTTATGLYGDRQGMPISNGSRPFSPKGTTDPAGSFAYWTDPVFDTARPTPTAGHDTNPGMVYAAEPPATAKNPPSPTTITPAPWVPYTRAGCNVGEVATANQELENTAIDLPKVSGPNSPEAAQLTGFGSINASQTLAYMSNMLESGVPVVNGYISDIHGNESIPGLSACAGLRSGAPLGPGSACYIAQAQYYNQAFANFFTRLAADGITPQNSLFVISSDEGDHVSGATVGRASLPTPANCDGATVSGTTVTPDVLCTYPPGTFGELGGNL